MKKKKKLEESLKEDEIQKKSYSTIQNIWYVMSNAFKSDKALLPIFIILSLSVTLRSYVVSYFSKTIIDLISAKPEVKNLIITVFIAVMVQFILSFANVTASQKIWWRYVRARMYIIQFRIQKCLNMDFELLESPKMLDVHQKAMNATGGNNNGVEGMMHVSSNISTSFFKVLFSGILITSLNPLIILSIIFLGFCGFLATDKTKKKYKEKILDWMSPYWRKKNYFNYGLADFGFAKDIRIFSMKEWIMGKYQNLNATIYQREKMADRIWQTNGTINNLIIWVQEIIVYTWLIISVLNDKMSIGDFVFYLGVVSVFFYAVNDFLNQITELRNLSREINDFRTFVEYEDEDKDELTNENLAVLKEEGLHFNQTGCYDIVFENVSFKYKNSDNYALKNLSLTLKTGERLAVVGLNGAGKTTFVKLLCRLYKPSEGRILINGTDISSYDKKEYYKLFAPLFQDIMTYAFPISENVSLRTPKETDIKRAEECLRLAGFGDKLDSLKNGVQTEMLKILYDDGIDLSGGEKQKLALARALYKCAPVIILDEPTSALDALAEYELYQNFDRLIGNSTAVYISHRLSSTRFCDHVAMFSDGGLIEYGTHAELIEKGGEYCKLFEVQAQYYKEAAKENEPHE